MPSIWQRDIPDYFPNGAGRTRSSVPAPTKASPIPVCWKSHEPYLNVRPQHSQSYFQTVRTSLGLRLESRACSASCSLANDTSHVYFSARTLLLHVKMRRRTRTGSCPKETQPFHPPRNTSRPLFVPRDPAFAMRCPACQCIRGV